MNPASIQEALEKRQQLQALRTLSYRPDLIDFCSNDFLGIAGNETLWTDITTRSSGSTGSRLISGNNASVERLECYLADIHHSESALVLNSGYNANLGLLSSVPGKHDTIIYDQQAHASIKDGAKLSTARHFSFRHNNAEDLEKKLKSSSGNIFVVVEAAYSMSGDYCPIHDILNVCKQYSAFLIVDEAHTTGMYGNGTGWCVEQGIHHDVFARVMTFGKAVGVFGACILGSDTLKQYLINFSRPFIYTTALPPIIIEYIERSFQHILQAPALRSTLFQKAALFASKIGVEGSSPIQAVRIPGNERVKATSQRLQQAGFDVRPIVSPTVKEGDEMLRICIHTFNSYEQIARLASEIMS